MGTRIPLNGPYNIRKPEFFADIDIKSFNHRNRPNKSVVRLRDV